MDRAQSALALISLATALGIVAACALAILLYRSFLAWREERRAIKAMGNLSKNLALQECCKTCGGVGSIYRPDQRDSAWALCPTCKGSSLFRFEDVNRRSA